MNTPTLSPGSLPLVPQRHGAGRAGVAVHRRDVHLSVRVRSRALSFRPMNGGGLWANYLTFFTDTSMWPTIFVTLKLRCPRR
jgi:putative spermidine/putrescine transport system permease protein